MTLALVALRVLDAMLAARRLASAAAAHAETIALNRYLAGEADYTAVVTAQTSAFQARQSEIQSISDRQVALVSLFQAIGGDAPGTPQSQPTPVSPSHGTSPPPRPFGNAKGSPR